jgi:hypothetical protein
MFFPHVCLNVLMKVGKVWRMICKRPYAVPFEQWRLWVYWDIENARRLALTDFKHSWGLKLMVSHLNKQQLFVVRDAFSVWTAAVEEVSRHDVIVQRIVHRWRELGVTTCFNAWKDLKAKRARAREVAWRVLTRLALWKLSSAFNVWAGKVSAASHFDRVCKRALRRWQLMAVTSCFSEWCDYCDSRRHARKLAGRVFARVVYGKVVSAWTSWVDRVGYLKRYESVCGKAAARLRQSSVLRAFGSWQEYCADRQHLRMVVCSRTLSVRLCFSCCACVFCVLSGWPHLEEVVDETVRHGL